MTNRAGKALMHAIPFNPTPWAQKGTKRSQEKSKKDQEKPNKKKAKQEQEDEEDVPEEKQQTQQASSRDESQVPFDPISTEKLQCENLGFKISVPGILIINGRPGSGKSHLERYVFYTHRHALRLGYVVSGTLHDDNNLDFVPEIFKSGRYDPTRVQWLVNKQKEAKLKFGKTSPAYFVADDYISDNSMWSDRGFIDMCTQCRHLNIWIVICTQHVNKIPPIFRESSFQSCVFYLHTKRAVDAAYDSYGDGFRRVQDFEDWMTKTLGENEFLFVNRVTPKGWSKQGEHDVFKAPPKVPPFKLWDPNEEMEKAKKGKKRKQKSKTNKKRKKAKLVPHSV